MVTSDALRRLSLVSGGVSDLAPLAGLTALEELDVGQTRIASLAAVAGLTALRSLCCSHNTAIADLGPLSALVAMRTLNCRGCSQVNAVVTSWLVLLQARLNL